MPLDVLRAARRAISARKRFLKLFENIRPADKPGNAQHSYFVDLLEKMLSCLRSCAPVEQKANMAPQTASSEQSMIQLENSFAGLEVNELPDEESIPNTTADKPVSQTTYVLKQPCDSEDLDEEDVYIILCFHHELALIIDRLKNIWIDYRDGKVDIMTASVTTDMAFQLAAAKELEFNHLHPHCQGPEVAFRKFLDYYMKIQGLDAKSLSDIKVTLCQIAGFDKHFGKVSFTFWYFNNLLAEFSNL